MAKIPSIEDLGARPIPVPVQAAPQDRSGLILSQGIEDLNTGINRAVAVHQYREDKFAYANAKSAMLQADIAARRSLENDPDYQTYETRYRDAMGKALEVATQHIRSPRDAAMFADDAKLDIERGAYAVNRQSWTREVDAGNAQLIKNLQGNREAALNAKDEASRHALVQASDELILGAREKGYLSDVDATNLRQKYTSDYGKSYVEMQTPEEQVRILSKPQGTVADFIDPADRALLLQRAQHQVETDARAAEAERRARKAEAWADYQRGQAVAKDHAWKVIANGGTIKDIPRNVWNGMDGTEQQGLIDHINAAADKATKGRSEDNIPTYIQVQGEIEKGNITDPKQLQPYAPYLKNETLKTLEGVIQKRNEVSPEAVSQAYEFRINKKKSKWNDSDQTNFIQFQNYMDRNAQFAQKPQDLNAVADRWFMSGHSLEDRAGRDPKTYGEAQAAGRTDFVVDIPTDKYQSTDAAYQILSINGYEGFGPETNESRSLFYTNHVLQSERIAIDNGLPTDPDTIAAITGLRLQGAPTTVDNIYEAKRQHANAGRSMGPTNPRGR